MIRRILTLAWLLSRDLFLSLAGVAPLAAALAFGLIAFEYGMDEAQFFTVGSVGTAMICLLTALLLAERANHAWTYPLLARLPRRDEMLAAIVVSSLAITLALALLISGGNLAAGRLTLAFPSALWLAPVWAATWLLAATLALPLSGLTSRGGSNLGAWVLVVALLVANDQADRLSTAGLGTLPRATTILFWPVSSLLARASAGLHDGVYYLALLLVLVYAASLGLLATRLFARKDLLWPD